MSYQIRRKASARFVFGIETHVVFPVNVERRHPRAHGNVLIKKQPQIGAVARDVSDQIAGNDVTAAQRVGKVQIAQIPRRLRPFALLERPSATVEKAPIQSVPHGRIDEQQFLEL